MIDLYSDTQTRPSPEMLAAMANATVGDEQSDGDPTTIDLCRRVADLLGKEAGVLMPSGTMCNLVAVLVHTRPGDEVITARTSHLYCTEAAGSAVVGGVSFWPVESAHGMFTPADLDAAVRPGARTAPRSALLSVEQTTFSGGEVWGPDVLRGLADRAHALGLGTHLDGARLLNAVAATGVPAREHAVGWDSAWLDLTKGLGCPIGAVLCGTRAFIDRAWVWKTRLGGAMRQSGIVAAAGLHALDHNVGRLREDHDNANLLWSMLSDLPGICFDPPRPNSNIVRFSVSGMDASALEAGCRDRGVRVRALDGRHVRATLHLEVSSRDVPVAAAAIRAAAADLAAATAGGS
jgi:threonine aldolase